jgi:hypothetical protein
MERGSLMPLPKWSTYADFVQVRSCCFRRKLGDGLTSILGSQSPIGGYQSIGPDLKANWEIPVDSMSGAGYFFIHKINIFL